MSNAGRELFSYLRQEILVAGYDVYDTFMPDATAAYPFVFLADAEEIGDYTVKNGDFGSVNQTIHIWMNDQKRRGTVSGMAQEILTICRKLSNTDNFCWFVSGSNIRILADTTTSTPLLHCLVEADFNFNRTGG